MKIRFYSLEYSLDEQSGIGSVKMPDGVTLYGNAIETWNIFIGRISAAGASRIGGVLETLGRNRFGLDENTILQSTAKGEENGTGN